jgi:hypothetical protein
MKKTMLVRCLFFFLFMGLILISPLQSFADYLDLGNTASDFKLDQIDPNAVPIFGSGVINPAGALVVLGGNFISGEQAVTNPPFSAVTDVTTLLLPGNGVAASNSSPAGLGFSYAQGQSDTEPHVDTQAIVGTAFDGYLGSALAQAFFFQDFTLGGAGTYTYAYLTSFSSTYLAIDGINADGNNVWGYSEAQYGLGWWVPGAAQFVPGNFTLSAFDKLTIGKTDIFEGHQGSITYNFDSATQPAGAVPAFYAYSESFAESIPEPATMMLLGLGLMGVAGIRIKFKG